MDIQQEPLQTVHLEGYEPTRNSNSTPDITLVTCDVCLMLAAARAKQLRRTVFGRVSEILP